MSITGGTLQSVLTSYSSYSTQNSSKQSSTETASSTTEDRVSLSAQSLSGDIETDSGSTKVELSAQSVSAEVTTESALGDYDLTSITPDDLDYISAELYNNGIISKEQFLTLGSIAFYHNHANGHVVTPDDSPFNLLNDLKEMASGNYDIMSACTWNWNKNDQSMIAISLLDILTDLEDDTSATVEVDYSLINISITA